MTKLWYLSGLSVWVYQGCFWQCIRHDKFCLLWPAFDIYQGYTFEFIKDISDTVLDVINAVYQDKPLINSPYIFQIYNEYLTLIFAMNFSLCFLEMEGLAMKDSTTKLPYSCFINNSSSSVMLIKHLTSRFESSNCRRVLTRHAPW